MKSLFIQCQSSVTPPFAQTDRQIDRQADKQIDLDVILAFIPGFHGLLKCGQKKSSCPYRSSKRSCASLELKTVQKGSHRKHSGCQIDSTINRSGQGGTEEK